MSGPRPAPLWPLILLAALALLGLAAHAFGLIDARAGLALAREHATQWWLVPLLVLLQALLFTFGLPGSAVLWLVAPLFAPAAATAILTTGSCLGALSAYAFARRLSAASLARVQASRGYRILQGEGDFLMLCALRLAPGFPHSVINYAAGVLRLSQRIFLAAAAIGFAIKCYLYSSVVHHALAAAEPADLLAPASLWPLVALAVVMLAARAVLRRRARAACGR